MAKEALNLGSFHQIGGTNGEPAVDNVDTRARGPHLSLDGDQIVN